MGKKLSPARTQVLFQVDEKKKKTRELSGAASDFSVVQWGQFQWLRSSHQVLGDLKGEVCLKTWWHDMALYFDCFMMEWSEREDFTSSYHLTPAKHACL